MWCNHTIKETVEQGGGGITFGKEGVPNKMLSSESSVLGNIPF